MLTLDLVSLLLTKENPTQSSQTLRPQLRDMVGIGTLGADNLAASSLTDDRLRDNKLVATGWKFLDIDRTVDSVMSSASELRKEIELETRYWADVLAVSEGGWAVSRLPNERQTLGVKFGFSEAAPEFKNVSSAPMRRADDGRVNLENGTAGQSQRFLVTIERDGAIVGRSSLPRFTPESAPLDEHVLEARNSVFSQELWHEINREGRTLLASHVRLEKSAVSLRLDKETTVVFTLEDLRDYESDLGRLEPKPQDSLAESISSGLQILLSYAHQQNNLLRSQPTPPFATQNRNTHVYWLLRPIIAYLSHEEVVRKAVRFMSDLTDILHSAGITTASYTFAEPPTSFNLATASRRTSSSESLCASLLSPREFTFELTITPDTRISVRGRTLLSPITQQYRIQLSPPVTPQQNEQTAVNRLQDMFPPSENYPDLREVTYYIQQAVARVLALGAEELIRGIPPTAPSESGSQRWRRTINGRTVCQSDNPIHSIRFDVCRAKSAERWDELDEPPEEPADIAEGDLTPELRVYANWPSEGGEAGKVVTRKLVWTAEQARGGEAGLSMEDVLRGFTSGTLRTDA